MFLKQKENLLYWMLFGSPLATSFYLKPFDCPLSCLSYGVNGFPFAPGKPMSDMTLHSDLTTNPLEPTSIGMQFALH